MHNVKPVTSVSSGAGGFLRYAFFMRDQAECGCVFPKNKQKNEKRTRKQVRKGKNVVLLYRKSGNLHKKRLKTHKKTNKLLGKYIYINWEKC